MINGFFMEKQLEDKFGKESNNRPFRWFTRISLEPGYALRNTNSLPKETPNLKSFKNRVIAYEIARLGIYGFGIYKIVEHFIK